MTVSTQNSTSQYIIAGLAGAGRAVVGLPLEHPFDAVKTRCQASLGKSSVIDIIKKMYATQGIKSFYSGFIPNTMRAATKQAYRWPMMLGFPSFFQRAIPSDIQEKYPSVVKTATGLSIASIETFVVCPLERMKVYLMTADHKEKGIIEFGKKNRGHLTSELMRGLNAVFARQMTSWVSFLVADEYFKKQERERTGKKELSFASLLRVSFYVGSVNTIANMPFDVLKTQLQQSYYIPNEGIIKNFVKIYQRAGLNGLYAGWQVRMVQYMIQSVFTVTMLAKLEEQFAKN